MIMNKQVSVLCVFLVALIVLCAYPANASDIHQELAATLSELQPDQTVGVLVVFEKQADIQELQAYFRSVKTTRQIRNETVVTSLMDVAERNQERFLKEISSSDFAGEITKLRPMWIINAISLVGTPDAIHWIADHKDVAMVYPEFPLELIAPVSEGQVYDGPARKDVEIENGIVVAGAPELWAMGIDGTGALVCDMDTGADGNHPAFASRWRGLESGVTPQEAWFDPVTSTTFPFDSGSHGTHTLGTILGRDGDYTVGMAPGATWIAAGVIDRVSMQRTIADALLTMQWTADPDGNPGTVDDVPDVTNNSWGVPGTDCEDTFWAAIDNAEAAGTVYVWAAGNEGPLGRSLRSPADRTETDTNAFSTGALKQNGTKITNFSSRGPSDCDGGDIKPEVCAVGDNVVSSTPNGNYRDMSGTSMAAPHVSGLVALLRSAHPDATVDEVKLAIMNNTVDLGSPGEDNDYGHGRIDAVSALGDLGFVDNGGIKGTVTDKHTDAPIANTTITIEGTEHEGPTGPDGSYRYLIPNAGEYTVVAYHPEYGTFRQTADVAIGPWTVVDFVLSNVPVADFEVDKEELCVGESVQFADLSTGLITAWVWTFGDSEISTEQSPAHTFNSAGSFTISLYAAGPTGENIKEIPDMVISYEAPVADFSASITEAKVDEEIEFTDLSAGPAKTWLWDFGDDQTSDQKNPTHAYEEVGVYDVTLKVTNTCGEQETTQEGYITVTGGDDADDDDDDDDDDGCGC